MPRIDTSARSATALVPTAMLSDTDDIAPLQKSDPRRRSIADNEIKRACQSQRLDETKFEEAGIHCPRQKFENGDRRQHGRLLEHADDDIAEHGQNRLDGLRQDDPE